MIGDSILDSIGLDDADRAIGCIAMAAEVEPDGLEPELRWIPPAGRADALARACRGEAHVLDHAIDLVTGSMDRVTECKPLNLAQALVILRAARRQVQP